jgi:hypothetical protein
MTRAANHSTIKRLVFDFIHEHEGRVDYAKLEKAVLEEFPDSKFKPTHWSWYRYQCTKGRFADQFTETEKASIGASKSRRRGSHADSSGAIEGEVEEVETRPISGAILSAVRDVIAAARKYEAATDEARKVGITGEVGEVLACHALGLELATDPRSVGFDALDADGKCVQIKTRRSESAGLPRDVGRLGTFSRHPFDYALLVLLDHEYELAEIWRAEYAKLKPLIDNQKRRNPSLSAFKKMARKVWPKLS